MVAIAAAAASQQASGRAVRSIIETPSQAGTTRGGISFQPPSVPAAISGQSPTSPPSYRDVPAATMIPATVFRDLVSGRRRGLAASLVRAGLRVASVPYGWAVLVRNRRY